MGDAAFARVMYFIANFSCILLARVGRGLFRRLGLPLVSLVEGAICQCARDLRDVDYMARYKACSDLRLTLPGHILPENIFPFHSLTHVPTGIWLMLMLTK